MSTKIYNGFKIDTGDISEVQSIFNGHQVALKQVTKEKIIEFLVKSAVEEFDKDKVYNNPVEEDKNYISQANQEMRDRQRESKKNNSRDPEIDFEAEIAIFPFEGNFYGIYYSEQNEFYNNLLKQKKVSEFSYYDNTDKPDRITKKEWEERERVWDTIFKGNGLPCEVGFTKKYNTYVPQPEIHEIIEHWDTCVPKFEKRLKYWTTNIYAEREFQKLSDKEKNSISNYIRLTHDESPEAQVKRAEIKKELENVMIKDLTPELLGLPVEYAKKPKIRI
jgi:hypothetical protein